MTSSIRFSGRAAIVTGAAGGIGQAIVEAFCQEGAQVLAVDRSSRIADMFTSTASVSSLEVDITDKSAPQNIIDSCIREFGKLDVVVNCAGIVIPQAFESITDKAWEQTFAVNTTAMMRISRTAVPHLRKQVGGRIINIGSTSSAFAVPEHASYCASKHAVAGLTKAMAIDLGKYGITVNYVLPGLIGTPMAMNNYDPEMIDAWKSGTAIGRIGTPDDIARVVLFLASEDSRYMTGAGVCVDAGHSLHE